MHHYLKEHYAEKMPVWLKNHKRGTQPDMSAVLKSRLVYYPGSDIDGQPIKTFVSSSSAHVFIYVDYGIRRTNLEATLSRQGFLGYHLLDTIELDPKALSPECRPLPLMPQETKYSPLILEDEKPYAFMNIYERNADLTADHGAERFAVIFLFADGIQTYDALFGNHNDFCPFVLILQDHGFGGNYDSFGKDGLLHKIAQRTKTFPELIILGHTPTVIWDGYAPADCKTTRGGLHHNKRQLFERIK